MFVIAEPGFDADTLNQYTLTLRACCYTNCSTNDLVVDISNINEAPYWVPSSLVISAVEQTVGGVHVENDRLRFRLEIHQLCGISQSLFSYDDVCVWELLIVNANNCPIYALHDI